MFILAWLFGTGNSSLHQACKGNLSQVRKLISQGADVNATDANGFTPLRIAVMTSQAAIVNELIRAGAKVEPAPENQQTLLDIALFTEQPEIVEALLNAGASPNETTAAHSTTPLGMIFAAANEEMLEQRRLSEEYTLSPERMRMTRLLVDAGADLEHVEFGHTRLMQAARFGDEELARCLLAAGVDVNRVMQDDVHEMEVSALSIAAERGHGEVVTLLIQHGADVNFQSRIGAKATVLIDAVGSKKAQVVRELLAAGADKSRKTTQGYTALDYAKLLGDYIPERQELIDLLS